MPRYLLILCKISFAGWDNFLKITKPSLNLWKWEVQWFFIWILQISKCPWGAVFFVLFLSKKTKLNLLFSLHEEVSINFNFIYHLYLSLSHSIYLSLSHSINLSLSLFPFLLRIYANHKIFYKCIEMGGLVIFFTDKTHSIAVSL